MAQITSLQRKGKPPGEQNPDELVETALLEVSSGTLDGSALVDAARNLFQFAQLLLQIEKQSSGDESRPSRKSGKKSGDA